MKKDSEPELSSVKTRGVGSAVVTKAVGSYRVKDITDEVRS